MVVLTEKLAEEKVWLSKFRYAEAEKNYYEKLSKPQKEGGEAPIDNGVQVKSEPSPKKKRKRNACKEESGAKGSPAGSRLPAGAKDTPAPLKEKKNNKDKKNSKQDRKNSVSIYQAYQPPHIRAKEQGKEQPESQNTEDLSWDMVDSLSGNVESSKIISPEEPPVSEIFEPIDMPQPVATSFVQSAPKKNVEEKRSKDKKKDRKSSWKADKIDDIAIMTSNNANLDHGNRITQLEKDNKELKAQVEDLMSVIKKLEARITSLEKSSHSQPSAAPTKPSAPVKKPVAPVPADEDDDVDLFGSESEEEDEASKKVKEQRLAEYAAKKSKKPVLIAKSNIILDVKPWDDETDMKEMEVNVRKISMDGLIWGASKLVPLAYGIHKLQISCVVEDDKVSVDLLTEEIESLEDFVQSVDIAAFNKV